MITNVYLSIINFLTLSVWVCLANLKNGFVLVCLNRFQQVITLHTFQAASESAKVSFFIAFTDFTSKM